MAGPLASTSNMASMSELPKGEASQRRKPVDKTAPSRQASVSSNWKALKKTMPLSVAAQELNPSISAKKRKRGASVDATVLQNPGDFVRGQDAPPPTVLQKAVSGQGGDAKGKGKAKDTLLGEGVTGHKAELGQYVSLDCEFVGLYDPANNHERHSLARVSMVNYHGATVYDTFVAQRERVGDWRTWVSGVRPEDVNGAPTYQEVQKKVAEILKGRILVGHAVHNDLKVLLLSHPYQDTRDTATYGPLRELAGTKRPSLKNLAKKALGIDIQEGEHSSVTDARATMAIYRTVQKDWEAIAKGKKARKNGTKPLKAAASEDALGTDADKGSLRGRGMGIRKEGGARARGGPGGTNSGGKRSSLGLAAILSKEKDWWSSGTLD